MTDARPDCRDVLRGLIAAWRSGDAWRAAAYFNETGRYREAAGREIVGRDALVTHFTRFFRDGPRWRFELDDTIVEGPSACVIYRFALEGTAGVWRERAGCAIATFDPSGAIAGWREYEG